MRLNQQGLPTVSNVRMNLIESSIYILWHALTNTLRKYRIRSVYQMGTLEGPGGKDSNSASKKEVL